MVVYKDAPPVFKTSGLARLLDFPDLQHCHGHCPDTWDHVSICGVVAFAAVGLLEVTSGVREAKELSDIYPQAWLSFSPQPPNLNPHMLHGTLSLPTRPQIDLPF